MTLHKLDAGEGYRYLTDQVAKGDGSGKGLDPMAYYQQSGNPAGRWMGTGAEVLGVQGEVTTGQMHNLYGLGLHPETGVQLGRRYTLYRTVEERVRDRIDDAMEHGIHLEPEQIAAIEHQEIAKGERQAVAGFDTVFSPVKSVSLAWGLTSDPEVARQIEAAHHAAVAHVVEYAERDVVFARTGAGGVAQVDVAGVAVAAFDHRTSRAGDPDLHTHAVISNKVLARLPDGKTRWLTLDSKALHKAAVAMSERYNRTLEDEVTRRLGWQFEVRADQDPAEPTAIREIAGVPLAAIRGFSSRRLQIEKVHQDLVGDYHREHGHLPPKAVQYELAQQATLTNRPAKEHAETVEQERERWSGQAARLLGDVGWASLQVRLEPAELAVVRTNRDVPDEQVRQLAAAALDDVTDRRSTWTVRHLQAAAWRTTAGLTMASPQAQDQLVERIVSSVLDGGQAGGGVVRLDPPELQPPAELQRAAGESVFRSHASERYTTAAQLEAEDALLAHARRTDAPRVGAEAVAFAAMTAAATGPQLTPDQLAAVTALATSGRGVGLLIGPAGTGKTTTLKALVTAWAGSDRWVHGLAPTAVAAAVLKSETGMDSAETLHRHEMGPHQFAAGDLVLVDESGMVGTRRLLRVIDDAAEAGAKVVLVGDHRQLGAIESGGALRLLATDAPEAVAELASVWRFSDVDAAGKRTVRQWEADASLQLRVGAREGLEPYFAHGRVHSGAQAVLTDELYQRWRGEVDQGWTSVMIAASNEVVADLGRRAREDRVAAGQVEPGGVPLADGNLAGVGDVVVTRKNDRLLRAGSEFVKNGDLWRVTARGEDGSLDVEHTGHGGQTTLPAAYVADRVEQGYAMTVHRTQGTTVDSTHTLVDPSFTREVLYVAATRGRRNNELHVVTDHVLEPDLERPADPARLARAVLGDVLAREDGDRSATETLREAYAEADALHTLLPRYRYASDLYRTGQAKDLLAAGASADVAERVMQSAAWPALADRLMLLEERGVDAAGAIAATLTERGMDGAEDQAAVLHARLDPVVEASRAERGDWLPAAPTEPGPLPTYLRELRATMESRAYTLGLLAAEERPEWTRELPAVPEEPAERAMWEQVAGQAAAYREAYRIESEDLLGPLPAEPRQREAYRQLAAAVEQVQPVQPVEDPELVVGQLDAARLRLAEAERAYWSGERAADREVDPEETARQVDRARVLLDRLDGAEQVHAVWEEEVAGHAAAVGELARQRAIEASAESRRERKRAEQAAAALAVEVAERAERVAAVERAKVDAERGLPAVQARQAARVDAQRTLADAEALLAQARTRSAEQAAVQAQQRADALAEYQTAATRVRELEARAQALGVVQEAPPVAAVPDVEVEQADAGRDLER